MFRYLPRHDEREAGPGVYVDSAIAGAFDITHDALAWTQAGRDGGGL